MKIPPGLLARIRRVVAKRPRVVLDHILKHGHVTTQELRDQYGYNHPPRAARDVREHGIALETFRVRGSDGRQIGAYRLKVGQSVVRRTQRGRRALPKVLKEQLVVRDGPRCQACCSQFDRLYLQIDHRVPYEVAGDEAGGELRPNDYMLLCRECNRAKSWACEHCRNWTTIRDRRVCRTCYWANMQRYEHVALSPERRAVIVWQGKGALNQHKQLSRLARSMRLAVPELIARIVAERLDRDQGRGICTGGRSTGPQRKRASRAVGDT